MSGNGTPPKQNAEKNLGEIVSEVSEKASQLVRQEIELAKAEISGKVSKLTRGLAVGAAAGVFLIFGVTMFFHTAAFFLNDLFDWNQVWQGYAVVTGALFVLAILAALLAYRLVKKGAPPTPDLAIEEAKLIREQFEAQGVEREQLERSKA
jgi:uncharacterized membrane protein YqjE